MGEVSLWSNPGDEWKCYNAMFLFVVLHECAVPSESQFLVLSTSGLILRILDPGTKSTFPSASSLQPSSLTTSFA